MSGNHAEPAADTATVVKAAGTNEPLASRKLIGTETSDVHAVTATMERSGAENVVAERVIMNRSGARTLNARSAQLDRSGVMRLDSDHAVMQGSSAVTVVADEARLVKSKALLVVASQATVDEDARVFLHIGPEATCSQPVLNGTSAAAFGAAAGLVLFLLRMLTGNGRR
jgi:hypothetical protein